jgi:4-hydroxybenzoate polyprenyltransferase
MNDPKGARPGLLAEVHDRATAVLSLAMVVIGLALVAQLQPLSAVLGLLFLAAGVGRLYVGARMRRRRRDEGGG